MSIINCDMTTAHIAGILFANDDGSSRRDLARSLVVNRGLQLIREPENKFDKNAVKIMFTRNGLSQQLGYLPKNCARIVSTCLDSGHFKVRYVCLSGSLKRNAITFSLRKVTKKKTRTYTKISCDSVGRIHVRMNSSDVCIYCGVSYKEINKNKGWRFALKQDFQKAQNGNTACVKYGHSFDSELGWCTWCGKGGMTILREGGYLSEGENQAADNHRRACESRHERTVPEENLTPLGRLMR